MNDNDSAGPEPIMRPIEMTDLDRIHELETEIFANPWSRRCIAGEIRSQGKQTHTRVIEIDGDIVAYIIAWFTRNEVHLANVAVAEGHRHKGYARSLVEWLIDKGEAAEMVYMVLEVRVTNVAAIRLYERLGFESIGVRKGYYRDGETVIDARLMVLHLGGA